MAKRSLTASELKWANAVVGKIRRQLERLSEDKNALLDNDLLAAYRRKIRKDLQADERCKQ